MDAAANLKKDLRIEGRLSKLKALCGEIALSPSAKSTAELCQWEVAFKNAGAKKIAAIISTKWEEQDGEEFSSHIEHGIKALMEKLETGKQMSLFSMCSSLGDPMELKALEGGCDLTLWVLQNLKTSGVHPI